MWIPVLLLTMILLAAGIGMIVSAASLFFRDVKFIVEVLLTFGIFFTPVFYDVGMFGDKGQMAFAQSGQPRFSTDSALASPAISRPNLPWLAYSSGFAVVAASWRVRFLQASGTGLCGKYLTGGD